MIFSKRIILFLPGNPVPYQVTVFSPGYQAFFCQIVQILFCPVLSQFVSPQNSAHVLFPEFFFALPDVLVCLPPEPGKSRGPFVGPEHKETQSQHYSAADQYLEALGQGLVD